MKLRELKEEAQIHRGNVRIIALPGVDPDEEVGKYHNMIVLGNFECFSLQLNSLVGVCPIKVDGKFDCSYNRLKTLEGCPREVYGEFRCLNNPMTSLHNIHKYVRRIDWFLYIPSTIRSHILGLLKIQELRMVKQFYEQNKKLDHALDIVNRYLRKNEKDPIPDIHRCQIELMEAGLARFAQL